MNIQKINSAHNYARAYLNCFGNQFSQNDYNACLKAGAFLKEHKQILTLLTIPILSKKECAQALEKLLARFDLPKSINRLFEVLIGRKQLDLLPEILEELLITYQDRNNIMLFTIESSKELTEEQEKIFATYLAKHAKKHILYTNRINPSLIAGIRMFSPTLLWDYSVARQLRDIKSALSQ
jgi:F-type H+-transporting ATPase subunit delta